MNVHQLELFYHVVLHQGVSQAAKALDKEQPTLSKQINELEEQLHVKLYQRRPFKLTERGEVLFRGIEPFFRELPRLEEQVRGRDTLRIGSSPIVLMDYLPAVEQQVRKQFPRLRLMLLDANQPQLSRWLDAREIDLAITLLPDDLPQKVFAQALVELPPVLLVPKNHPLKNAGELWAQPPISHKLICLASDELPCKKFQAELIRRGLEWRPEIEVGSLSLVEHYVEQGYGVGLSLQVPKRKLSAKLRMIELPGFPRLSLGMLWRDNEAGLLRSFREHVERAATQLAARG